MDAGGWVMDAGGWVMDAGTRPISRAAARKVCCGVTKCLLWQDKTSVVARDNLRLLVCFVFVFVVSFQPFGEVSGPETERSSQNNPGEVVNSGK